MRQIRAYLLFTGWRYKLVMFLGLPGAVLAGGWLWRSFTVVSSDGGGPGFHLFSHLSGSEGFRILTAMLLIFIEILSDQAVFNGIQSKRGYKLDFLKTSPRGREVLWQGLTGDLVRRMLTAGACACAVWVTKVLTLDGGLARGLGLVLAVFSLETLGLFISRFTRSILLCLYTAYGCAAAGVILLILVSGLPVSWLWAADGLLALTAAALSVLVVGIGMKKWHETFADSQETIGKVGVCAEAHRRYKNENL